MKIFVVLSAVVAVAMARPGFLHAAPFAYSAPLAYAAAPYVPVEVSSQFHAQDSLGQYNYGYTGSQSAKAESRLLDGVTRGAYSYVDAEGKLQSVQYSADDVNGFQVAATNLPVAPVAPVPEKVEEPRPVVDTPEVAKAKEDHFAAVEEAKSRAAFEIAAPVAVSYAAPAFAHYAAPAVAAYAHQPYGYYPYAAVAPSSFGYHYSSVAPAYTSFPVHSPFVGAYPIAGPVATPIAGPLETPVAAPVAADDSDDTVEVKAKVE